MRRNGRTPRRDVLRVAAYARISVADRDGATFTSIEAQVDSVTSYIRAQASQGWQLAGEPYVDDGFTGGNANRPALQRLLEDVRSGLLDAVVVHRFDRFSRSQRDFLNLLHVLDQHDVAFVSVNETLDTGTPMGRCMLGVMTAFAQLERETIAERTRTKIHASRRKGIWTGGRPILGYDIVDKRLVVNTEEADQVRAIFELYLETPSLMALAAELGRRGWRNKRWTTAAGKETGGEPFTKSTLQTLLRNPLYRGLIRADDDLCEGQHEAIVDEETWQAVQDALDAGRRDVSRVWRPSRTGGLLAGLVKCAICGAGYTYHYAKRGSKRYSYLVCGRALKQGAAACKGSRAPAGEFEAMVIDRLRAVARDPSILEATLAADRETRATRTKELAQDVRRLVGERTALDTRRRNLVAAVAQEGASKALTTALAEAEEQLAALDDRLAEVRREQRAYAQKDLDPAELRAALAELDGIWGELFPAERARLVALLVERVDYDAGSGAVEITFRPTAPEALRSTA